MSDARQVVGFVVNGRDVGMQRSPEERVLSGGEFLGAVLEHLEGAVVACDATGAATMFNEAARRFHGLAEALLPPSGWAEHFDLLLPDQTTPLVIDDAPLFRALSGELVQEMELVIAPKQGRSRLVRASGRAVFGVDGSKLGAVISMREPTGQAAERELLRQSSTDVLTGLGNRASLADHLHDALGRRLVAGSRVAVLVVDLDDFKKINDSLGHAAGDLLLIEMAERLRGCLREPDAAVRLGGDEFAVVLEDTTEEQAALVADAVLAAVRTAFSLEDSELRLSASIGIAVSQGGESGASLLRAADLAMYVAKSRGKGGYAMFEPHMQLAALGRLSLEEDLRRALAHGQLTLAYQPVVSLTSGAMVGVEALIRWHPPGRSPVRPEEFIPVAEDSGLIGPIGAWVLEEACAQAQRWDEAFPDRRTLTMAVNISARQLQHCGLTETLVEVLERTGLRPGRLVLELTESTLTGDDEVALTTLREIELLGVRLAVDDFGTGYSSLSRLRTLPITAIKIDRSFVNDIDGPDAGAPLVAATLAMAKGLGLSVVAEGIETADQLEFLRRHGCPEAQGFLMSRPVDASAINRMLEGDTPLIDIRAQQNLLDLRTGSELMVAIEAAVTTHQGEEETIRPLLDEMARITDLESTYLTQFHRDRSEQEIRYARNTGQFNIPEGLKIQWADVLCRQALLGGPSNTDEVPMAYPNSTIAHQLGLQTYVSVPVTGPDGRIFGTLCGASSRRRKLGDTEMAIVHLFARLITDKLAHPAPQTSGPE